MKAETKIVKLFKLSLIISAGDGLLFFSSCRDSCKEEKQDITSEDVKEELEEAGDTTAEYLDQQREEIIANYRSKIENTQEQIDDLRNQMESTTEQVKVKFKNRIDTLQKQQAEVQREFNKLQESSGEAWDDISKGLDKAIDNINNGIQKAQEEFKK